MAQALLSVYTPVKYDSSNPEADFALPALGTKNFVLYATVNTNTSGQPQIIFAHDRSCYGASQFRLQINPDQTVEFVACDASNDQTWPGFQSQTALTPNETYNIRVERVGTEWKLFINDHLESTKSTRTVLNVLEAIPGVDGFRLGARYPPNGSERDMPFSGQITNVYIVYSK